MMRRPVDSLFGRLAVLIVGVLMLSHLAWYALIRFERRDLQNHYAVEETVFLMDSVEQHLRREPDQPLPSRVQVVEPDSPLVPPVGVQTAQPLVQFAADLQDRMPPGTQIRIGNHGHGPPTVWIMPTGAKRWIALPIQPLTPRRPRDRMLFWLVFILGGAVLSALLAAWQFQRPLHNLVEAVARFGRGLPVAPLAARGPRELRQLTQGFNQMVSDISQAETDRGVMLAGVAHDLKTPLARLRLRAEMVDEEKQRNGIVRDVDSLAHIVDQFLVFAHDRSDQSAVVEVDGQCERFARHYRALAPNAPPIELELAAGDGFQLPAATLERILSNLLDNAHAYGAPPFLIATQAMANGWRLTVADHGGGISPQDLQTASRPFVRLDPARGGNGHSGLGLAIVERLAKRIGGECRIGNMPGGGLRVDMDFPRRMPDLNN